VSEMPSVEKINLTESHSKNEFKNVSKIISI